MPEYEFRCAGCGKEVTIRATVGERERGLSCPHCGSHELHRIFGGVTILGSSRGGADRGFESAGGACGPGCSTTG